MENPVDILGADPTGAVQSPHDARDYLYKEVGFASAPFDWTVGYDVEVDTSITLGTKNQGQSGSCGGQAESYYGAVLSAVHDQTYEEKSAKFTYAPVAVVPGGGSAGRSLADRSINAGWGSEVLTPSYENGQPPSEAFMERVQDITPEATQHALKDKAFTYALVDISIDEVAKAIRDNKGLRIGVSGSNNGTWLSEFPKAPNEGEKLWRHWLYAGKAKMITGVKYIGVKNSWGDSVGDHGWQWLSVDWFLPRFTNDYYGVYPVWEPRTYVFNPNPVPAPSLHHQFTFDLELGMHGPEVEILQTALQIDGEFPVSVAPTLYYGPITRDAVEKFQVKYGIVGVGGPGYGRCGPKTRAKLNSIFGS